MGEVEKVKKSTVHRYRFPLQDTTIERALELRDPKTKKATGELHAVDYEALTIDLKRGPKLADAPHPTALVPYDIINAKAMRSGYSRATQTRATEPAAVRTRTGVRNENKTGFRAGAVAAARAATGR